MSPLDAFLWVLSWGAVAVAFLVGITWAAWDGSGWVGVGGFWGSIIVAGAIVWATMTIKEHHP